MYPAGRLGVAALSSRRGVVEAVLESGVELATMSIVVSSLTIATQLALSHVIRGRLSDLIQNELLKGCLLELVAAAEMCGSCYELIIIADNYGVYAYAVYLWLMTIWWGQSWGTATACPYSLLEEYVEVGSDAVSVVLKIIAQVIGGLMSFRWVKYVWMMELAATHVGRGVDDCTADLQVPVVAGFLIECVLTCACRLVSRALGEIEPKFASAIDSFFATSMVVLAFNYSGGYFNPVLATGLKWSCRGHTNAEHVIVYWAGSILGAMLSIRLWNLAVVKNTMVGPFKPKAE
ncbi:aquaporin-11-like isoform X1 [Penaeus chinensis]|uniref:aquaporin-11-like isoform X1 n=2 Tax=Penaeus chinensis TaxID=139456 RepID=UPI001FB6CC7A|nr:aquaporin-11-like isoform X1 [Penaeus chinensis]